MTIDDRLNKDWETGPESPIWGAVVLLMDDDIRERVHADLAPCSQREFWEAYCAIDPTVADVAQF